MLIKVDIFKNESGIALVIGLIMIVVLTVVVLAASLTSVFEIKLAGNKRGSTDAFYAADSGVQVVTANVVNFDSVKYPADGDDKYQYHYSQDNANKNPTKNPTTADIIIYHDSMRTDCPRGYGFSATQYDCRHFLIESTGQDQIELNPVKSASTIQEKVVRPVPKKEENL